MNTHRLQVSYPGKELAMNQDQEWFHVVTQDGRERIRIHEYDRVYEIPGLYEEVVYNKLQCDSPQVITGLLKETIDEHANGHGPLRVLDFGAGNGIVGEHLRETVDTEAIVGIDIIDEAQRAAKRDRPGIYNDYYVMDLSQPNDEEQRRLDKWNFNALVTVAALGFGDIPTQAFMNAFNIVEDHSWIAFNIKDRFFSDDDDTGYNQMLQEMIGNNLQVYQKHHYCHRLSMAGEPLYYYAVIGRKGNDA